MDKDFIVISNIELENIKKEIKNDIKKSYEQMHLFLKEHQDLLNETQKVMNTIENEENEEYINKLENLYINSKWITSFLSGFFLSTIINFFFL